MNLFLICNANVEVIPLCTAAEFFPTLAISINDYFFMSVYNPHITGIRKDESFDDTKSFHHFLCSA